MGGNTAETSEANMRVEKNEDKTDPMMGEEVRVEEQAGHESEQR